MDVKYIGIKWNKYNSRLVSDGGVNHINKLLIVETVKVDQKLTIWSLTCQSQRSL